MSVHPVFLPILNGLCPNDKKVPEVLLRPHARKLALVAPRLHVEAAGAHHHKAEGRVKPTDCVRHPGVPVAEPNDYYCAACVQRQWNAGAAYADAHWADTPQTRYQDERSPDGRSILKDHQGFYKRDDNESKQGAKE